MKQRGSPNVEPSQSAPTPGKLTADQPGEPRKSRVKISAPIAFYSISLFEKCFTGSVSVTACYVVRSRCVHPFYHRLHRSGGGIRVIYCT